MVPIHLVKLIFPDIHGQLFCFKSRIQRLLGTEVMKHESICLFLTDDYGNRVEAISEG